MEKSELFSFSLLSENNIPCYERSGVIMNIFKRKVFIVLRTTVYSNEYVERYGLAKAVDEPIEAVFSSERQAIGYIRGYIKGVIHKCESSPMMKEYCISEVPSVEEIKHNDIRFYHDDNRDEWITYIKMEVK